MSAKQEEVPQLVQELIAMEQNIQTLSMIESFLGQITVRGSEVKDLSRCLNWVEGMRQGTRGRADQIRAELPKDNVEVQLGPDEPKPAAAAITVGPLEAEKGSPVLGPA